VTRLSQLLLLLPVLVLVVVRWRYGRMPDGRVLFLLLMGMVLVGAALAWFGNRRALDGAYVPAVVQDGRVVPGHGSAAPHG
jgi:hypothetical protein